MARRADIVSVEAGLHEGAETALRPGRHTLGDSLDDDIVVMGDGLEPAHLTISVLPGRLRTHRAITAHAPLRLGDQTLAPGDERTVRLPATIEAGDVRMVWRAGDRERTLRPLRAVTVGACALAGTLLLSSAETVIDWSRAQVAGGQVADGSFLTTATSPAVPRDALAAFSQAVEAHRRSLGEPRRSLGEPKAQTRVTDVVQTPSPVPPKIDEETGSDGEPPTVPVIPPLPRTSGTAAASAPIRVPPTTPTAEAAAASVSERLRDEDVVGIELAAADGMIVATGTLDASHEAGWQATQRWFDELFAGDVQLVNQVRFSRPARSRVPSIEAVWVGDPSYVVIGNDKHVEGAVLRGGWTVQAIERAAVVLVKKASNERVRIEF